MLTLVVEKEREVKEMGSTRGNASHSTNRSSARQSGNRLFAGVV
jgi:hypothetical protein